MSNEIVDARNVVTSKEIGGSSTNRYLFKRMCAHFGIVLGQHTTAQAMDLLEGLATQKDKAECFDWIEANADPFDPRESHFFLPSVYAWKIKPGPELNTAHPDLRSAIRAQRKLDLENS